MFPWGDLIIIIPILSGSGIHAYAERGNRRLSEAKCFTQSLGS